MRSTMRLNKESEIERMKRLIVLIALCATVLAGCDNGKHVISVDRLEKLCKINVLYVAVAEVYRLATPDESVALSRLVRGGAYYSIDLSLMKLDKRNAEEGDTVSIKLPAPIIESYPDPARSVEFKPYVKLFYKPDSALKLFRESYDAKDREKISVAANKPEYMKMAKEQAEKILRDMLPELKVKIEWLD